jgi:hypothetical protein
MSVTPIRVMFSDHATRRVQQRGIRPAVVDFVLRNADRDLEAGNGCRAYRISKKAQAELLLHGAQVGEVELATNVVVILHEDSGEVITAMHDRNKSGRRYRRQWPTWSSAQKHVARGFRYYE